ncbi:MAG: copper homeostasis protein CutC [Bacteroidales bacterium]|nr:copper homeostasis protein CutC [Bacteroidales bacterium]
MIIESCCTSLSEALAAQGRGADRIELCVDLSVGGLTPPTALVEGVAGSLSIPVNVLIRPSEYFVCGEADLQQMLADIEHCKSAGAAGIVTGVLKQDGTIDIAAMRRLIDAAHPLPVTFHRAFDVCSEDPFGALEKIVKLGCKRLLTSGMAPDAWTGKELIAELVRRAEGRIIIMPGCGIHPGNLKALAAITLAREFHGTRLP